MISCNFFKLFENLHLPQVSNPFGFPLRKGNLTWPVLLVMLVVTFGIVGCRPGDIIGSAEGWTPVKAIDGTVYVASKDGRVMALDAKQLERNQDTSPLWTFDLGDEQGLGSVFSPPAIGETHLYVGGAIEGGTQGRLVRLRKDRRGSDGNRIRPKDLEEEAGEWKNDFTQGSVVGGPVLFDGVVLVGSEDGYMYAFNSSNGERLWRFATEGLRQSKGKEQRIWSTPAVSNGVVYFGAMDDYIYALSVRDGELLWRYKTQGAVNSDPLVVDDIVVVGSFDRKLYALDANNHGVLLWTFEADGWFWAGSISDGKLIYTASMDGVVYALDPSRKDGDPPEWYRDLGEAVIATPFLARDELVVATEKGKIFLLSTADGGVEEIPIDIDEAVRAPLSGDGQGDSTRVYVGDQESVVYSIDVSRWSKRWAVSTKR